MLKLFSFLAMAIIIAVANPKQQDKEYKASLTLNEWNVLISNPDDVAANARKAVIQKIIFQIEPQVKADTLSKKK